MNSPTHVNQIRLRKVNQPDKDIQFEIVDQDGPIAAANQFLRTIELRGLSKHTFRSYAYDLVIFYRWLSSGGKVLEKLKLSEMFEFIAEQRKNGISARSINRRLTVIRVFFSFCFDREMERGPGVTEPAPYYRNSGWDRSLGVVRIQKPGKLKLHLRTPRKIIEPLKPDEVNRFLKDVSRYRDLAIYLLMLFCGLRSCEVLSLTLNSVDWDQRKIRILGKGQKERIMPLPEELIQVLKRYLRYERPTHSNETGLFLLLDGKKRGERMSAAGLRSLFRNRRRICQVGHANPHRWRHSTESRIIPNQFRHL